MFQFKHFTLRQFAFALLAGIAAVGFLGMLLLEATESRERELHFAEGNLRNLSRLLESHTRATVEKIDVALQAGVSELQPVVAGEGKTARLPHDALARLLAGIPESQSLRVVDATGKVIFDASGAPPSGNVSDRKYFQRNKEDAHAGLVISEPILARFTGNWVITLSRRIENRTGNFVGLIQAAVRADYFEHFYDSLDVGDDGVIGLYDNELRLIARHPAMPEKLGSRMEGTRVEQLLNAGMTSGVFEVPSLFDGQRYLFSFSRMEGLPFVIVVGTSRQRVLAEWTRKVWLYGVTACILSAMLLGMMGLWLRNYRLAVERAETMAGAYDETARHMLALLNSLPDPAWLKDGEGRFISVNEAYLKLVDRPAAEVIGKTVFEIWPPALARAFDRIDRQVLLTQSRIDSEGSLNTPDGAARLFEYTRTPVRDESGRIIGIAGVARDVTERVRAEQRIRYLAEYDQLTDLPNRIVLSERMAEIVAGPHSDDRRLALMMVDLDRFKHINESLGHDVGDRLLQQLAGRLKELVGDRGMVSRHGGDKFAVLMTDSGGAVAIALFAKELIEAAKRPYVIGQHEFALSASIGIAMYPQDGNDLHTLLKNADAAMYHAKEAGRGSFQFFSPEMNMRVFERLSMENSLRKALEQREFRVYYQPKLAVAERRLTGFEALLRWPHPVQGMIPPGRFIPVAEDTQLILPIGECVLFEACSQNRAWQQAGYEIVPVAVNLSMVQFRQRNLVEMVADVLIRTGLEPRYLELEITESVVMHDSEHVIGVLDQLKRLGVVLSIDDFGTGYSSLSYLRRFPIDKIKIDHSFVQHLPDGGNDAAIAETIIAIAAKLDLDVVAEGVENEAQLAYLLSRGCDEAQGFLFSPALPAEEVVRYLSRKGRNGVASPVITVNERDENAG